MANKTTIINVIFTKRKTTPKGEDVDCIKNEESLFEEKGPVENLSIREFGDWIANKDQLSFVLIRLKTVLGNLFSLFFGFFSPNF